MNNKKSKNFTFISDLVKPIVKPKKTKIETSASVSELVKSKKTKNEISTFVSNLIKSKTVKKSKNLTMADLIKPKKRYLYLYHCKRCDGAEVDFCTQESHMNDKSLWNSEDARKNQKDIIIVRKQNKTISIKDVNPTKKRKKESSSNSDYFHPFNEDTDPFQPNNNENIHTLFSSSQSSSKLSYFHVPAFDENKEDGKYIDQDKDDDEDMNQG